MPALTAVETQAFLDEPAHLVRIATVDENGMPRAVPTWFIRRGDNILFTPRARSIFLANLRRDPRVGLTIDEEPLPYRKVTVQGSVTIEHEVGRDDEWRDTYRAIACRYVDPEAAEAYIQSTMDQPRALVAVSMTGTRVLTWRMPVGDEDPTGIWARRYYLEGTKMAAIADGPAPA
ncbi:MAG: hypothetical protein NVS3B21_13840 [Acidimicrobiales bacterium]